MQLKAYRLLSVNVELILRIGLKFGVTPKYSGLPTSIASVAAETHVRSIETGAFLGARSKHTLEGD